MILVYRDYTRAYLKYRKVANRIPPFRHSIHNRLGHFLSSDQQAPRIPLQFIYW